MDERSVCMDNILWSRRLVSGLKIKNMKFTAALLQFCNFGMTYERRVPRIFKMYLHLMFILAPLFSVESPVNINTILSNNSPTVFGFYDVIMTCALTEINIFGFLNKSIGKREFWLKSVQKIHFDRNCVAKTWKMTNFGWAIFLKNAVVFPLMVYFLHCIFTQVQFYCWHYEWWCAIIKQQNPLYILRNLAFDKYGGKCGLWPLNLIRVHHRCINVLHFLIFMTRGKVLWHFQQKSRF